MAKRGAGGDIFVGELRPARSAYRIQTTPTFEDGLKELGRSDAERLYAKIQQFERHWRGGLSEPDLTRMFDYKALNGSEYKKWGVRQLTLLRNFRVILTDIPSLNPPIMYYAWTFRKTRQNDKVETNRGMLICKSIRERLL